MFDRLHALAKRCIQHIKVQSPAGRNAPTEVANIRLASDCSKPSIIKIRISLFNDATSNQTEIVDYKNIYSRETVNFVDLYFDSRRLTGELSESDSNFYRHYVSYGDQNPILKIKCLRVTAAKIYVFPRIQVHREVSDYVRDDITRPLLI